MRARFYARNNPTGFTLVEIMMVLAIASLLTIILLGLYGKTQQRAQFSDAVERVQTDLDKAKSESNSSFTTGNGDNKDRVFYAKAVAFNNGGQITISTITADRNDNGQLSNLVVEGGAQSVVIPWGVTCSGADCNTAVVFTRQLTDGILNTYVLPKDSIAVASSYTSAASVASVDYLLVSPENLQAKVNVNSSTNEVKVTYCDAACP